MPDFSLEAARGAPDALIAGIDEVGRGPLAGPVVAAALVFLVPPPPELACLIDDSKRLTAKRREKAFDALRNFPDLRLGLGAASVTEIEQLNIANACHLAMRRALARLPFLPAAALVDGSHAPLLPCPVNMVVGGDKLSLSIAGASIAAKVVRDRLMTRLAVRHDSYAWERNAGYGTAAHMAGLRLKGVTHHHRRGFAPIRAQLALTLPAGAS
ncbi:ribonuclease HII [Kozakia baliensis]|uniref:Ribonuclease HII n=1 Tax=Kozakia baliensis TaxID=153496 RepID=A0A1D8UUN3_9PROT|nr:ribonuclease HII [Kozakia baliensis]AOX17356.1 ribonuclease HII [Kozakia baliensis]AOX20232.1 ribonuclease HII [Kozakia baliensis]GBR30194.1 ribonuclease HII [Kozakia baliensis NRIC 0488]GEL63200.1 ribonuclease HII [Kozakia baliensis]